MDCEYSVAVQSSDVAEQAVYRHSGNARAEASSSSGTSAVVDFNGRAHNMKHLINPNSPRLPNSQPDIIQQNAQLWNDIGLFPSSSSNDTVVLSDKMVNQQSYYGALESSSQALSLALGGDLLNNQVNPSQTPTTPYTPLPLGTEMFSEELFEELQGIDQVEPMLTDISEFSESNSYSYDNSSAPSGFTPLYGSQDNSSMVTGVGVLDNMRPCGLSLPSVGSIVFSEQQAVTARKTDMVPPTPTDSVPIDYPRFSGLEDTMLPSVHPESTNEMLTYSNQVTVKATEESKQKPGSIGEDLNLIKMMKRKPKTGPGFVPPDPLVPSSQLSQQPSTPPPHRPRDFPVQVSSPAQSVASDTPSPAPSVETPDTPATSTTQGPFSVCCGVRGRERYFELGIRKELKGNDGMIALKALFYCCEMHQKFKECMDHPCDLKVANNTTAKLCKFDFDSVNHKLVTTVPRECVPLDKFLKTNKEKIDLRARQYLLQQVLNALANVHTRCGEDKMSFWGSFLVWVDHEMSVYLLLDFPVMLAKMEQSYATAGFDPRLQDFKAVHELYSAMFKPFINSASSWPSPGLTKLLGKRFEHILTKPGSGSRMAEIARNFGERRMCRIETDVVSIETVIYCLEHETLQMALSPLETVIPPGISAAWEIQDPRTGRPVGKEDIAVAGQVMKFQIVPCFNLPSPYREGLLIFSRS